MLKVKNVKSQNWCELNLNLAMHLPHKKLHS